METLLRPRMEMPEGGTVHSCNAPEFQYEMSCQTLDARSSEANTTGRHERACSSTPSERASSRSMYMRVITSACGVSRAFWRMFSMNVATVRASGTGYVRGGAGGGGNFVSVKSVGKESICRCSSGTSTS